MFTFLGDASKSYQDHFSEELKLVVGTGDSDVMGICFYY